MKITISISTKEMSLFRAIASKVKAQIIDPIKGQISTIMGNHKNENDEKKPIKARIRECYENSMIVTTEKWDDTGVNASIEIKTGFIEKVSNLISNLIDEAAPSIGAFSGAMMIFMGFINSTTSKIKSFIEKIKKEEEEGSVYTNNVFFPDENTVVNALIRKNRFGSAEHIGWVIESSKKLSFEEELRLVELIEIAIENNDYSNLNHHFVAASFNNREEAETWFRQKNKISTMFNVVKHLDGWTIKDWRAEEEKEKEEKEEEEEEEKEEKEEEEEENRNEKIESLLKTLTDCFDQFKADQSKENLLALRKIYKSTHKYWVDMTLQQFEVMTTIRIKANKLISDPFFWL